METICISDVQMLVGGDDIVQEDTGKFIAVSQETEDNIVWGYGESPLEALKDATHCIKDYNERNPKDVFSETNLVVMQLINDENITLKLEFADYSKDSVVEEICNSIDFRLKYDFSNINHALLNKILKSLREL